MTQFRLGVIADDLTGATDLGALLGRRGIDVSVRVGPLRSDADGPTSTVEIVARKIRTEPADDAVEQAVQAFDWLKSVGATHFYWKYCSTFDSTPTGNIGPVADMLMRQTGQELMCHCPSFPENGRRVFMGNLYVNELPLSESSMKDHPLTPMRDANLVRVLSPQVSSQVGLVSWPYMEEGQRSVSLRLNEMPSDGISHCILDAIRDADLQCAAASCDGMVLAGGGSAFGAELCEVWANDGFESRHVQVKAPKLEGPAIILSGSCSEATNQQVSAWRAANGGPAFRLDPLELAVNGITPVVDWLEKTSPGSTPIVFATAAAQAVREAQDKLGVEKAGEIVEQALASCAKAAASRGIRRFVVAGGETAGAVVTGLGIDRLDIGIEIAPGVPWCRSRIGDADIDIVLKSGNFGGKDFFADALG